MHPPVKDDVFGIGLVRVVEDELSKSTHTLLAVPEGAVVVACREVVLGRLVALRRVEELAQADARKDDCKDSVVATLGLVLRIFVRLCGTLCQVDAQAIHCARPAAGEIHLEGLPRDAEGGAHARPVPRVSFVHLAIKGLEQVWITVDEGVAPQWVHLRLPELPKVLLVAFRSELLSPSLVAHPLLRVLDADDALHAVLDGQAWVAADLHARAAQLRLGANAIRARPVLSGPRLVRPVQKLLEPRVLVDAHTHQFL
mmetsp:Transcript_48239/g.134644  ORF Transcript_48239/g.134644 Transcript_48239/m.134644 type:complete len:256 (-) Transcript_48239:873-1640(-)